MRSHYIEFKKVKRVDVDDCCLLKLGNLRFVGTVGVDMAVEEIARLEATHEGQEGFEAGMGEVRQVVDAKGGGMGDEDVKITAVSHLVLEQAWY